MKTFEGLYSKLILRSGGAVMLCVVWDTIFQMRSVLGVAFFAALPDKYPGADKSLARPTSRSILFDGENTSFDASLVIYI